MPAGNQSQSQKNTSSKAKPAPVSKPNGPPKPASKPATAVNRSQATSRPPAAQSSNAESDSSNSKELHAQIERLQREVKKLKSEKTKPPPARIILRPSGEAGNRKTGFILIDAMGLSQNKDEYNRILLLVRDCCKEVKLERQTRYRHIDHTKLAAIIQLVRKRNEFMNSGAFPSDWPVAEIC
ncbi:hypothetical protein CPC08DRAFT_824700 [Agrocybe pediades]|nr:hypothetical protein CPC08DRAFT_824700 [Agrocybe pediades]